ncbi:MAG: twin-arginine translocase subunit TatC [Bacteroidales bacterium]|nr:twin-arginine translocase subunit TatC [Bacteroidales bacterium]
MRSESFLDHLEALRRALWRSVAAVAVALIPGIWAAPRVLRGIIRYACPEGMKLNYFSPMEPFMAELNLGLGLAVLLASPVILWELGKFIAPGLHPRERRYLGRLLGAALVLLLAGASMGFFGVAPLVMRFSGSFAGPELTATIGLGNFLRLVLLLALGFAVMFQLPVVLLLLVSTGLVRVRTLRRTRPIAVVLIFVLAAVLTPPDVLSQLLMALPAWLLFEIALLIAARMEPPESEDDSSAETAGKSGPDADGAASDVFGEPPPEYRQSRRKKRRIRPL